MVTADSNAVTTVQDISPLPDKLVLGVSRVLRVLRNEGQYKFHFPLCLIGSFVGSHGTYKINFYLLGTTISLLAA